ncbi:response regulator [Paenibacillus sp. IB182496]|uniref:Response regulator n=1 Tax=Paenibacillus sabuli TaxID=2772509 RepID=A0A927BU49_9BACL|nr:response regulator [Paenibacillus sabuli]MBD2845569.1 response regulator [Paenibacillus sabuli]
MMRLFTLIIADDEPIIRDELQEALDWEELGFRIVGAAQDGEQALALTRRLQPDAALLDIKMPGMTGLEALAAIKRELPQTEVVLLSGYDEFGYAKQGLKEGAFDYVLKMEMFPELEETLRRLCSALELRRAERRRYDELLQLQSSHQFRSYLSGRLPDEQDQAAGRVYAIATVWLQQPEDLQRYMRQPCPIGISHIVHSTDTELHVLFRPEANPADLPQARIAYEAERLGAHLAQLAESRFAIGVGTVGTASAHVAVSYREALKAADYLRHTGGLGRILSYARWPQTSSEVQAAAAPQEDHAEAGLHADCTGWIYAGDARQLERWLRAHLAAACLSRSISLADMQALVMQMLMQFDKALQSSGEGTEYTERLDELRRCESLVDLQTLALDCVRERCALLHQRIGRQRHKSVAAVQAYIDEHFTANLRLEEVAQQFHYSAGHLSSRFKAYSGVSFSRYIIDKRITTACELLAGTALKIYEIANQVGYTDERHFSKLFTQLKGIGPREYRGRHKKQPIQSDESTLFS